jgi:hypothetical protein
MILWPLTGMLHPHDHITQALQADPQGFEAGFAIVFASDESTVTRDQAYLLLLFSYS